MGIPKFYRWLSERYPCISQVVTDDQIPVFDNLYLDMNGIVHNCSHGNNPDPNHVVTEETVFNDVFAYVDTLFKIIKPRKVFYMAIDGVAPRAKMNQQRARRFRSAQEAEESRKQAVAKGIKLSGDHFDSNCITPGTGFMNRLSAQIKYFIHLKISTDMRWRNVKIIFSGHEVPGEGEHKIMEYIRQNRSQSEWDPNTKHCIYGLDADLIVLGLLTHEPHFALLREEVVFGKNKKVSADATKVTFNLLHLSLVREYTAIEFDLLENDINFERVIDDWVLICYLIGNDFIPHLPNLHIDRDGMTILFDHYKENVLSAEGGPYYLHNGGTLDLANLQRYLCSMSDFDHMKFEEQYESMQWIGSKMAATSLAEQTKLELDPTIFTSADTSAAEEEYTVVESNRPKPKKLTRMTVTTLEEKEQLDEQEFNEWKHAYYKEKFEVDEVTPEFTKKVAFEYLHALQWNLHYYYDGIVSWSWFYPYHYAPMLSDLKDFADNLDIFNFTLDAPFTPFQQLMAVLPPASVKHVPEAFRTLMLSPSSPILDFYPKTFKSDLNGKKQPWEAIALLCFIDESRLVAAMSQLEGQLTKEEKKLMVVGTDIVYTYNPDHVYTYTSPWIDKYPNIVECQCQSESAPILPAMPIQKGLLPGVVIDGMWGFATFSNIPHTGEMSEELKVQVFSNMSRASMVVAINVDQHSDHMAQARDIKAMAKKFLGQSSYFAWPHLKEGLVTRLADYNNIYTLSGDIEDAIATGTIDQLAFKSQACSAYETSEFKKEARIIREQQLKKKGIQCGIIDVIAYVRMVSGVKQITTSQGFTTTKLYSGEEIPVAVQLLVEDKAPFRPMIRNITEQFPIGSDAIYLGDNYYGGMAKVLSTSTSTVNLSVSFEAPVLRLNHLVREFPDVPYYPQYQAARMAGMSTNAISRITSSCQVDMNDGGTAYRADVGLNIKFQMKSLQKPGYSRRNGMNWEFSDAVVTILREYKAKFPEIFLSMDRTQRGDRLNISIFGENKAEATKRLAEIKMWIHSLPCYTTPVVSCGTDLLSKEAIVAMDKAVQEHRKAATTVTNEIKHVSPNRIYQPIEGSYSTDDQADFFLGDRVISASQDDGSVPFASHGIVVGVRGELADVVDILFDRPFLGGTTLEGRGPAGRGAVLKVSSLINITYGQRRKPTHQSRNPVAMHNQMFKSNEPAKMEKVMSKMTKNQTTPWMPRGNNPVRNIARSTVSNQPTNDNSAWTKNGPPSGTIPSSNWRTKNTQELPDASSRAKEGQWRDVGMNKPQIVKIAQRGQKYKGYSDPDKDVSNREGANGVQTNDDTVTRGKRQLRHEAGTRPVISAAFVPSQALRRNRKGQPAPEPTVSAGSDSVPTGQSLAASAVPRQPNKGHYPQAPTGPVFIPAMFSESMGSSVAAPLPAPPKESADLLQKLHNAAVRAKKPTADRPTNHVAKENRSVEELLKGSLPSESNADVSGSQLKSQDSKQNIEPAAEKPVEGSNENEKDTKGKDGIDSLLAKLKVENEKVKKQQLYRAPAPQPNVSNPNTLPPYSVPHAPMSFLQPNMSFAPPVPTVPSGKGDGYALPPVMPGYNRYMYPTYYPPYGTMAGPAGYPPQWVPGHPPSGYRYDPQQQPQAAYYCPATQYPAGLPPGQHGVGRARATSNGHSFDPTWQQQQLLGQGGASDNEEEYARRGKDSGKNSKGKSHGHKTKNTKQKNSRE